MDVHKGGRKSRGMRGETRMTEDIRRKLVKKARCKECKKLEGVERKVEMIDGLKKVVEEWMKRKSMKMGKREKDTG